MSRLVEPAGRLLHDSAKAMHAAIRSAYRKGLAVTRRVGRENGCPFIRSDRRLLAYSLSGGVVDESYSWTGSVRGLIEFIESAREGSPDLDLVSLDITYDAHEYMDGDGYDVTQAEVVSVDLWTLKKDDA